MIPEPETVLSVVAAKRTTRNAATLMLSAIVTKGLLFLWQIFLARRLGVAGYGVYATIGALMMIGAAIPELGLGLVVIRDLANRPEDAGRYLGATLTIQPILAMVGYAALLVIAALLGYGAELRGLLALAALSLLIDSLGNMVHNQLIASERMVIAAGISIGHTAVLIILGSAVLVTRVDLWSLYVMFLIAGALRTIAYWAVLLRSEIRPAFPVTRALAKYLCLNGTPFAVTAFLFMAFVHCDKLIVTALIGTEGTGQLMASFIIVFGLVELLSTPVLVTVLPMMSRLYNRGPRETYNLMLEQLCFYKMLFSLPLAIFVSLTAIPLSRWIFGNSFLGAAAVLRIMIWYVVVNMAANTFSQSLTVQNRQRWLTIARAAGLLLNVLLNLLLLPRLGISGAAVAMLTTELVVLSMLLRPLLLPAEWWRRMLVRILRVSPAALALTAITLVLRGTYPQLTLPVGLVAFAALLFLCGVVTEADRNLFSQLFATLPGSSRMIQMWRRTG